MSRSIFNSPPSLPPEAALQSPSPRSSPPLPSASRSPSPARTPSPVSSEDEFRSAYGSNQSSPRPPSDGDEDGNEDDGDDEDDEFFDTRNRWGEHVDTKQTVAPFQQILAGIEWEHLRDLPGFLYSAYRIKQDQHNFLRPSSSSSNSNASSKRASKRRKIAADVPDDGSENEREQEEGEGERKKRTVFLTAQWTKWPLPFSLVPRESEHRPHVATRIHPEDTAPELPQPLERTSSQMLRECIMAEFLRIAKERIRAEQKTRPELEPADDDEASERLLRPVVNSVMSKINELLEGLHVERENYVRPMRVGVTNLASPSSTPPPREKKGKRAGRTRGKSSAPSAPDDEEGSEYEDGDDAEEEDKEDSAEDSPASTRSRPRRRRRKAATKERAERSFYNRMQVLKPRDWSQVLGIAQLRGWNEAAVQRASERCARMFGQDMLWRSLRKGGGAKERIGKVWYASTGRVDQDQDKHMDEGVTAAVVAAGAGAGAGEDQGAAGHDNETESEDNEEKAKERKKAKKREYNKMYNRMYRQRLKRRRQELEGEFLKEITFGRVWQARERKRKRDLQKQEEEKVRLRIEKIKARRRKEKLATQTMSDVEGQGTDGEGEGEDEGGASAADAGDEQAGDVGDEQEVESEGQNSSNNSIVETD